MATFYGGDQLANVLEFEGHVAVASTLYTIPSGHYGIIKINHFDGGSSAILRFNSPTNATLDYGLSVGTSDGIRAGRTFTDGSNAVSLVTGNPFTTSKVLTDQHVIEEFKLPSGTAIVTTGSGLTYSLLLFVYKKP